MPNNKKKIILTVLLVLVSAGVLSAGIYYTWLITPPSLPKTAEEGLKTINSARYQRLPDYRKEAYLEQTQNLLDKLPEDKRLQLFQNSHDNPAARQAMREVRENEMNKRIEEFAKAGPEDRIKILDQMIDQMEARRKQFEAMRANGQQRPAGQGMAGGPGGRGGPGMGGPGGGRGGRGPGRMADRIKSMAQNGNPQRMALRREFHQAMQARMAQRGITPPQGRRP